MSWEDILKRKPKSGPREAARKRMKAKGLKSFNSPQRLNDDSGKSHHVMASEGGKYKYIKFGQKGVKTNQTAGQERHSNHAMLRISSVVKCRRLIGLIKSNGVQVRPKNQRTRNGERGLDFMLCIVRL